MKGVHADLEHARALAVEHCRWARAQGQRPTDVARSIIPNQPRNRITTWEDAAEIIARAWLSLHRTELRVVEAA